MPPKSKITKEMILSAAFNITRFGGIEAVNARSLAKELDCSTQPIFSQFSSMNELKEALFHYVEDYYNNYALSRTVGDNFFQNLGLAYLDLASNEKYLFKFLFMSEYVNIKGFNGMFGDKNLVVANIISRNLGISLDKAKMLFMKIWIFMHGIASMVATESIKLDEGEAAEMLKEAYNAFLFQARNNN